MTSYVRRKGRKSPLKDLEEDLLPAKEGPTQPDWGEFTPDESLRLATNRHWGAPNAAGPPTIRPQWTQTWPFQPPSSPFGRVHIHGQAVNIIVNFIKQRFQPPKDRPIS